MLLYYAMLFIIWWTHIQIILTDFLGKPGLAGCPFVFSFNMITFVARCAVVVHAVENTRSWWFRSIGSLWVLAVTGWAANMSWCAIGSHRQTGASLNTWHEVLGDWYYSIKGCFKKHSENDCNCYCANNICAMNWLICFSYVQCIESAAFSDHETGAVSCH